LSATIASRSKTSPPAQRPPDLSRPLEIGDRPHEPRADANQLRLFLSQARAEATHVLGFPGNLDFDYSDLPGALGVLLNNVGDPLSSDASDIHSKVYEREVIRFLTRLANGDPEDTYGYVTSGGSEANLFGLLLGRRRLPHAPIYCNEDAHYGIRKAAELLRMKVVPVPRGTDGGIDIEALHQACSSRRSRGAIVVVTLGTTMLGAIDDLSGVRDAAAPAGPVYVHVDGALGGLVAAFAPSRPHWGFDADADSVMISGHKLIGMPMPCGVVMAREEHVAAAQGGEYTGATDSTLGCSRSGLAALLLWRALRQRGRDGLQAQVLSALDVAAYAERRLAESGRRPWRHPASITVVFDRPSPEVCAKWHLCTEGTRAHIVTVPHVTQSAVDELCCDMRARGPLSPLSVAVASEPVGVTGVHRAMAAR
jgi:histidine decarboxylase